MRLNPHILAAILARYTRAEKRERVGARRTIDNRERDAQRAAVRQVGYVFRLRSQRVGAPLTACLSDCLLFRTVAINFRSHTLALALPHTNKQNAHRRLTIALFAKPPDFASYAPRKQAI